uniref:Uncharacterized protein n=1 Tax=Romanomermis culicivorax TaxID=13658 RepID=A0A915IBV5_ROMCU
MITSKNASFCKANGSELYVSDAGLKRARSIFTNLEDVDEKDIFDEKNERALYRDLNNAVDINALKNVEHQNMSTSGMPSFRRANGNSLHVSDEAFKKAQALFVDFDHLPDEKCLIGDGTERAIVFDSSTNNTSGFIKLSEKSDSDSTNIMPSKHAFFCKANGNKLGISDAALKKAQDLFADLDESIYDHKDTFDKKGESPDNANITLNPKNEFIPVYANEFIRLDEWKDSAEKK